MPTKASSAEFAQLGSTSTQQKSGDRLHGITEIDAISANIASIIQAIGFGPNYSWIEVDAFYEKAPPLYKCRVWNKPDLYFIDLGSLNTWGLAGILMNSEVTYLGNTDATETLPALQADNDFNLRRSDGQTIAVITSVRSQD